MAGFEDKQNVEIAGREGTWSSIESRIYNNCEYYLMESDTCGVEPEYIITDEKNNVVIKNASNGWLKLEIAYGDNEI